MNLTVIIPYYQRQTGLLARAIDSIAAQKRHRFRISIIIVDDQSPIRAVTEIDTPLTNTGSIRIVEQANTGVAGARNAGLQALPTDTDVVAFLDSDDAWSESHLQHIEMALEQGADFFCGDYIREGESDTAFATEPFMQQPPFSTGLTNTMLPAREFMTLAACGFAIGTSTVAVRADCVAGLRFDTRFTRAKEDTLFWLDALARCQTVAVFNTLEVNYGKGVNIYAQATGQQHWGLVQSLVLLADTIRFNQIMKTRFADAPQVIQHAVNSDAELRKNFAATVLHTLRTDFKTTLSALWRQVRLPIWQGLQIVCLEIPRCCLKKYCRL